MFLAISSVSMVSSVSESKIISEHCPPFLGINNVKINAILDDASNETFLNEEVAGVLGLQEPFQKVEAHVLMMIQ